MTAPDPEARWKSDVELKLDRLVAFADEYFDFVKMLKEREVGRQALRRAVIEKTLGGLIWSALAVIGIALWHYIKELLHIK